ncbi:MAG: hypothetical protein KFF50_09100 [Desulfatitalea sp.]|nr:hypothetical protein [Desulfatitalea sp.]
MNASRNKLIHLQRILNHLNNQCPGRRCLTRFAVPGPLNGRHQGAA